MANLAAGAIILLHLAIAISALDLHDLSRDEARYWEVSGRTLRGMIAWSAADNYPPLLFLLMAVWRPLLGESEVGLRLPFAVFSALALFVFWRILRRKAWLPAKDAVWVLALVALSPMQIFIATLAKYYTLLELLGLMFWYGMEQLMERGEGRDENDGSDGNGLAEGKRRSRLLTAVVVTALAMIYLHYLGFVIVASFFLAAVLVHGWASIGNIIRQFKLRTLILLLYLPWIAIFLYRTWANLGETSQLAAEQGGGAIRHLAALLATPYGLFWGNSLEPWHFGLVALSIILILGALIFALTLTHTLTPQTHNHNLNHNHALAHHQFRFLWLYLILSFILTFLIITFFMRIPILFYAERFTFLLPFFLTAILLSWPVRWRRPVYALTLCLFLFANYNFLAKRECLNWSYNIEWSKVQGEISEFAGEGAVLVFDNKNFGALGQYYFRDNSIIVLHHMWDWDYGQFNTYLFHTISRASAINSSEEYKEQEDVWRRRLILLRSSRDNYPLKELTTLEYACDHNLRRIEMLGMVADTEALYKLKQLITGKSGDIIDYKIHVLFYERKTNSNSPHSSQD